MKSLKAVGKGGERRLLSHLPNGPNSVTPRTPEDRWEDKVQEDNAARARNRFRPGRLKKTKNLKAKGSQVFRARCKTVMHVTRIDYRATQICFVRACTLVAKPLSRQEFDWGRVRVRFVKGGQHGSRSLAL